jgi:hypothetical protein
MSGPSTQQGQTQGTTTTSPWGPTQGALQGILGQIQGQMGNTGMNSQEQGAFNTLQGNANGGNPYAAQIGSYASNMLNGGGANSYAPGVQNAYNQYSQQIMPWANGSMGDPNTNPALRGMLNTIQSDTSNSINSQFAGAGRDMSGMNQQALARGLAQGESPLLMQAQQQGLQSAGDLYNAGNSTQGILAGLNQQSNANMGTGVGAAGQALDANNWGANQTLGIQSAMRQLPLQNMSQLEQMLTQMASLGGQSTSQGTSSQTYNPSQLSQMNSWMSFIQNAMKTGGTMMGG